MNEVREFMRYAIESDLDNISVPVKGELKEIVSSMSAKVKIYNTMLKLTDEILVWDALNIVDSALRPIFQICKKVGLHRQDFAFEAGRLYERSKLESHDHLLLDCFMWVIDR